MSGWGDLLHLATASGPGSGLREAVIAFVLIALLLGGFILILALIGLRRQRVRRRANSAAGGQQRLVDPWREAGQRVKP